MIGPQSLVDDAVHGLLFAGGGNPTCSLYGYIAHQASPRLAQGFTNKFVDHCQSLEDFPERGAARSDLRSGLRTLTFRRVMIAYAVEDDIVTIIGVFYGGQDYETILADG